MIMIIKWVIKKLCPTLGRYSHGQPYSEIVMDRATTYMDPCAVKVVEDAGDYLLYTAL